MQAYTIGIKASYDFAIVSEPGVKKLGRTLQYPGGWVWRSLKEAQQFIEEHKDGVLNEAVFQVYGLILPNGWNIDVSKEVDSFGVHNLLVDAEIRFARMVELADTPDLESGG